MRLGFPRFVTPVSQTSPPDTTAPADGGGYDAYAIQQKSAGPLEPGRPVPAGGETHAAPQVRAGHVPVPVAATCTWVTPRAMRTSTSSARFWRARRYNVLNPIGWDSFGLPAENAAIQRGADPREWTYANIAQHKKSFREYGSSYDWSRILHTSDPEHDRWNQWLFQLLYERGLAYRKESPVNWCPNDQTVLANEQVVDGHCERCGAEVVKKKLTQWYFKITDYADRLLDDLEPARGLWPQKVIRMQRNWIGRSVGADIDFEIEGREGAVTVFSTRPDTLHGATFFVVAPDSDLAAELAAGSLSRCAHALPGLPRVRRPRDRHRASEHRPSQDGRVPRPVRDQPHQRGATAISAADYVVADYGHGAVIAVPAHDQRDLDFARAFDLPVKVVVARRRL